jgi:hypothetical protein
LASQNLQMTCSSFFCLLLVLFEFFRKWDFDFLRISAYLICLDYSSQHVYVRNACIQRYCLLKWF